MITDDVKYSNQQILKPTRVNKKKLVREAKSTVGPIVIIYAWKPES